MLISSKLNNKGELSDQTLIDGHLRSNLKCVDYNALFQFFSCYIKFVSFTILTSVGNHSSVSQSYRLQNAVACFA